MRDGFILRHITVFRWNLVIWNRARLYVQLPHLRRDLLQNPLHPDSWVFRVPNSNVIAVEVDSRELADTISEALFWWSVRARVRVVLFCPHSCIEVALDSANM